MKSSYVCVLIISTYTLTYAGSIGNHHAVFQPPHYEFQYSVHDADTGDVKDQFEHRHGDYVIGRYSFIEPNGNRRIVDYSSDPLRGFSAHVRHEPPYLHPLT